MFQKYLKRGNEITTMDKQSIAENLEKSILDRVRSLLLTLPDRLTEDNAEVFVSICERIDKITTDAFTEAESLGCRDFFSGWRCVLAPWWIGSYGSWEYAYGKGFTWKDFIKYILDSKCNAVTIDSNSKQKFLIELGKED